MPIRINLLAEAQAAEELRRKDPVKRALFVAITLVALVLFWSSTLQMKIVSAKGELGGLEARWKSIESNYQTAVDARRNSIEAEEKLLALQQFATNRFLWGNALNAFQQTLKNLEDVRVVRLKTEQIYIQSEDPKGKSADPKAPKAMLATEKINIMVDGLDASPQPGGQINSFKSAIANEPYFLANLQKTNNVLLLSLSPPQVDGFGRSPFVKFSLQCFFPEKVR